MDVQPNQEEGDPHYTDTFSRVLNNIGVNGVKINIVELLQWGLLPEFLGLKFLAQEIICQLVSVSIWTWEEEGLAGLCSAHVNGDVRLWFPDFFDVALALVLQV